MVVGVWIDSLRVCIARLRRDGEVERTIITPRSGEPGATHNLAVLRRVEACVRDDQCVVITGPGDEKSILAAYLERRLDPRSTMVVVEGTDEHEPDSIDSRIRGLASTTVGPMF